MVFCPFLLSFSQQFSNAVPHRGIPSCPAASAPACSLLSGAWLQLQQPVTHPSLRAARRNCPVSDSSSWLCAIQQPWDYITLHLSLLSCLRFSNQLSDLPKPFWFLSPVCQHLLLPWDLHVNLMHLSHPPSVEMEITACSTQDQSLSLLFWYILQDWFLYPLR